MRQLSSYELIHLVKLPMLRRIPRLGLYPKQVIVFQTVISKVRGEF
nr:MAG TPA: hypothetical protein [Caudoviricetes sp.]